ncbi:hypothetical protein [Mycolicibacterium komossense]|uniref:Uncharacterized protein n=1 Tax=Mycolicibacterium komossense TaxID=1779 RepID=A0ABT3C7H6_9MYCO|nr:hypothetical protein [Mycolicibacterium komossense]MCV7225413.1 hypothetical protein [Mycolicibacterium komossense]
MSAPAAAPPRELFPGYSVPSAAYSAVPLRHTSLYRLLLTVGASLTAIVVTIATISTLFIKPAALYSCPPECGRPPTGVPVQESPRFTAADGSFSVSYPSPGTNYTITKEDSGVSAVYTGGDGGTMELFGVAAAGRTPEQVLDDLIRQAQPDATVAYQLPNAMVGFQLGHGEVLDVYPQTSSGDRKRTRIVVLVAVKNDLALVAAAIGPFREFGPDSGPGLPSGANLELAEDLGKYVNSFLWRGDPPR